MTFTTQPTPRALTLFRDLVDRMDTDPPGVLVRALLPVWEDGGREVALAVAVEAAADNIAAMPDRAASNVLTRLLDNPGADFSMVAGLVSSVRQRGVGDDDLAAYITTRDCWLAHHFADTDPGLAVAYAALAADGNPDVAADTLTEWFTSDLDDSWSEV